MVGGGDGAADRAVAWVEDILWCDAARDDAFVCVVVVVVGMCTPIGPVVADVGDVFSSGNEPMLSFRRTSSGFGYDSSRMELADGPK